MKQRKKKSACDLAVEHFDMHYKPVYDFLWPSVRVALLSKRKHCALINNFVSDGKKIDISLAERGAHDFIWTARERFVHKQSDDVDSGSSLENSTEGLNVLTFFTTV